MFVQTNSVRSIKEYFKKQLKEHFSENEINFILKETVIFRLKLDPRDYLLCDQHLLSESDLLYFRSIVKRLLNNEPFQYIMGSTEFFGLNLKTDHRALIPRPETEELVEWITKSLNKEFNGKIVDMCTGSGCIALALKSHFSNANIVAADLSTEALNLVNENASQLNLEIEIILNDALKGLTDEFSEANIWVSNPPYIPLDEKKIMKENVVDFEPHIALFVQNDDPLIFYREIGKNAFKTLLKGGKVYFELHENLGEKTKALLEEIGFVNIELRKDLQGKVRMIMGQKP